MATLADDALQDIVELKKQHRAIDEEIATLRARQRSIDESVDAARRAFRPEYPTDAHRAGALEAFKRIQAAVPARSHLGDACGPPDDPRAVVCTPGSGGTAAHANHGGSWLSFAHRAPYSDVRRGAKLWRFEPEEQEALVRLMTDQGLELLDSWTHDDGLAVVVR